MIGALRKALADPTKEGAADGKVYAGDVEGFARTTGTVIPLTRSVDITANVAIDVLERFNFRLFSAAEVYLRHIGKNRTISCSISTGDLFHFLPRSKSSSPASIHKGPGSGTDPCPKN